MNTRTTPQVGEWTALLVGYKRQTVGSAAHRVGDDGRTLCGFLAEPERRVPPPVGFRRCVICALSEAS